MQIYIAYTMLYLFSNITFKSSQTGTIIANRAQITEELPRMQELRLLSENNSGLIPGLHPANERRMIHAKLKTKLEWQIHHLMIIYTHGQYHIDGLVQDCNNSIAATLELLQSCT